MNSIQDLHSGGYSRWGYCWITVNCTFSFTYIQVNEGREHGVACHILWYNQLCNEKDRVNLNMNIVDEHHPIIKWLWLRRWRLENSDNLMCLANLWRIWIDHYSTPIKLKHTLLQHELITHLSSYPRQQIGIELISDKPAIWHVNSQPGKNG